MVACKCKLGKFLLDDEIAELLLIWELITETKSIIIKAEADTHLPAGRRLHQIDQQLIIMVTDLRFLSPHRLPGLVKGGRFHTLDSETFIELFRWFRIFLGYCSVRVVDNLLSLEDSTEFITKVRRKDNLPITIVKSILGCTFFSKLESHFHIARR